MPKDQEPFADTIPRLRSLLVNVFLKNRDLHFQLVDSVIEKEDLLGFGVNIHGGKAFEASFTGSSGESGRQQGGFDDQGNTVADDLEVLIHRARQTSRSSATLFP